MDIGGLPKVSRLTACFKLSVCGYDKIYRQCESCSCKPSKDTIVKPVIYWSKWRLYLRYINIPNRYCRLACSPLAEFGRRVFKTLFQLLPTALKYGFFGYKYIWTFMQAVGVENKKGSQKSLGSVALYRFAHLFTGYKSATFRSGIFFVKYDEKRRMPNPVRPFIYIVKLLLGADTFKTFYAANLFLPFARRALMIFLPFLVFILARNPWVLLRGVLCGWYVLFIRFSFFYSAIVSLEPRESMRILSN